ncbi:carbon-nitrogen hydrolase family protein [candidate division KSB1 bacterium]
MKKKEAVTRRRFLKKVSSHVGAGVIATPLLASDNTENTAPVEKKNRLPREVWVASIELRDFSSEKTTETRLNNILVRMERVAGLQPDIICLPETFNIYSVQEKKPLEEVAEDERIPGPVTSRIAEFAKKHNCYIVCPIITRNDGRYYNSGILIDRKGRISGVFHKVHPDKAEIVPESYYEGGGITPGPVRPPVFETDFGKIGMQIGFDANWFESWDHLKNDGAEIVFFPSWIPSGRMLNFHAWKNGYHIVSSSVGDARIIDISGVNIQTSSFQLGCTWASLNLEKEFMPGYLTSSKISSIFNKYGRRLGVKVYKDTGGTGCMTFESLDPDLKVLDVLREFEIPRYMEEVKMGKEIQDKHRP